jgi:hypothetical protein
MIHNAINAIGMNYNIIICWASERLIVILYYDDIAAYIQCGAVFFINRYYSLLDGIANGIPNRINHMKMGKEKKG